MWPQFDQTVAKSREEFGLFFAELQPRRSAKGQRAIQRDRKKGTAREDSIEIVDPYRNQLNLGMRAGNVINAASERTHVLACASRAFWKEDEGLSRIEGAQNRREWISAHASRFAIN